MPGLSPRVRGNPLAIDRLLEGGLSPRVRGNPVTAFCGWSSRSIPACAGEPSNLLDRRSRPPRVYPRVCGGNQRTRAIPACAGEPFGCGLASAEGLSPRVRGNLGPVRSRVRGRGSIPACAGEPAHGFDGHAHHGSIPACAGEPHSGPALGQWQEPRSIPACAGEPRQVSMVADSLGRGLSPRVRGNPLKNAWDRPTGGLSPRVRGNLCPASRVTAGS